LEKSFTITGRLQINYHFALNNGNIQSFNCTDVCSKAAFSHKLAITQSHAEHNKHIQKGQGKSIQDLEKGREKALIANAGFSIDDIDISPGMPGIAERRIAQLSSKI